MIRPCVLVSAVWTRCVLRESFPHRTGQALSPIRICVGLPVPITRLRAMERSCRTRLVLRFGYLIDLEEAPTALGLPVIGGSASLIGVMCDGVAGFLSPTPVFIASSAPNVVHAQAAVDLCAELIHDTAAIDLSTCAVTETSPSQVDGVHFGTFAVGVYGPLVAAGRNSYKHYS
jgi:hypothetical protein